MAAAGSGSNGSEKGKGKSDDGLASALKNVKLRKAELDDVYVGVDEIGELGKSAHWLAVAKVNTTKTFSVVAFKETMKFVFSLAHVSEIREVLSL